MSKRKVATKANNLQPEPLLILQFLKVICSVFFGHANILHSFVADGILITEIKSVLL